MIILFLSNICDFPSGTQYNAGSLWADRETTKYAIAVFSLARTIFRTLLRTQKCAYTWQPARAKPRANCLAAGENYFFLLLLLVLGNRLSARLVFSVRSTMVMEDRDGFAAAATCVCKGKKREGKRLKHIQQEKMASKDLELGKRKYSSKKRRNCSFIILVVYQVASSVVAQKRKR